MLLELLFDFQISIPELGRIEAEDAAGRPPDVNNTRELTEALKRRCLYLWLDYPDLEHELQIVRLHAPELDETVARKLDRHRPPDPPARPQEPPSIAESIDWACTLLLLGANDIDYDMFIETMSVIVKHRTDLDTVAARVGVRSRQDRCLRRLQAIRQKRRDLRRDSRAAARQPRRPAPLVRRGPQSRGRRDRHVRDPRRVRGAEPRRVDRLTRLQGGPRDHARQVQRRPPSVRARVRPVLLPRHRGPGRAAQHHRGNAGVGRPQRDRPRHPPPADRGRAQGRLRRGVAGPALLAIAALAAARLRRPRRGRPTHQTRARTPNRTASPTFRKTTPGTMASPAISSGSSSSTSDASSSAT